MAGRRASLTCAVVWTVILGVTGFNLDTSIPVVKDGPPNSYFGYSVAQHQELGRKNPFELSDEVIGNHLVVGAPILNIPGAPEKNTGGVYKCNAASMVTDDCELLLSNEYLGAKAVTDSGRKNQWLGVSVQSGGKGKEVVACAHRYKKTNTTYGLGTCYHMSQELKYDAELGQGNIISPCTGYTIRKEHEEYAFCQTGTSVYVTEENRLIMGAPGAINWRGMLAELDIDPGFGTIKRIRRSPTTESDSIPPPVKKLSYLGYSVVAGRFDISNATYYVAGAPRSNDVGEIIFFQEMESGNLLNYKQPQILRGTLPFSGFGQALIAVDLNNDGYDELVVGAPFYHMEEKDNIRLGGAIYIYSGGEDMIRREYTKPTLITGRSMNQEECDQLACLHGRFGFSLSKAGDLNRDGFQDFAVGAPYEGKGAVYIFHGSKDGVKTLFSQRIYASDLFDSTGWASFGYSLSGGLDLDNNTYPDLLVGSLEAHKVALLRTRPIIHLHSNITLNPPVLNMSSTVDKKCTFNNTKYYCITIKLCLRYTAEPVERFQEPVDIIYTIIAEPDRFNPRVEFRTAKGTTQKVEDKFQLMKQSVTGLPDAKNPLYSCVAQTAYLKNEINDVVSPMEFGIGYRLPEKKSPLSITSPNALPDINEYPILETGLNYEETLIKTQVEFVKKCGPENICESNLHLDVRMQNLQYNNQGQAVLDLGSTTGNKVQVQVTIQNTGEVAYQTTFYLKKPAFLGWGGYDPKRIECTSNDTMVICTRLGGDDIGKPLKAGNISDFTINLNYDPIQMASFKGFELYAWVNTSSVELTPKNDFVTIPVTVFVKADLQVTGRSYPDSDILYSGRIRGESAMMNMDMIGKSVSHTFTIYNNFKTVVKMADITIYWPYELASSYPHGKHLLYLTEPPQIVSGDALCIGQPDIINVAGIEEKYGVNVVPRPFRTETTNEAEFENEAEYETVQKRRRRRRSRRRRREVEQPQEGEEEERDTPHQFNAGDGPRVGAAKERKNSVLLDCDAGNVKCHQIRCKIGILSDDKSVRIELKSRLWESTLLEHFRDVDEVRIRSKAELYIRPELNIKQTNLTNDVGYAETVAIPSLQIVAEKPLQWWIIALAVLGGIILLVVLALCLWKLGFFKRKRYDEMKTYNVKLEKKKNIDNPTYSTKVEATKDYTDEKEYFLKR